MTRTEITKNVTLKHRPALKSHHSERETALESMQNKIQIIHFVSKDIISETVKAFKSRRL